MSCKVSQRQVGPVTILEFSGRVTLADGAGTIKDAVQSLIAKQHKRILLNLNEILYIDSTGLGELASSYATTRSGGGELKVLNSQKRINDLLSITRLSMVFEIFDDETTALESFKDK